METLATLVSVGSNAHEATEKLKERVESGEIINLAEVVSLSLKLGKAIGALDQALVFGSFSGANRCLNQLREEASWLESTFGEKKEFRQEGLPVASS